MSYLVKSRPPSLRCVKVTASTREPGQRAGTESLQNMRVLTCKCDGKLQ